MDQESRASITSITSITSTTRSGIEIMTGKMTKIKTEIKTNIR
ncbi:Uncharacterised protein [Segatella copri]|nr:Uncharacterised protein [Segatella copri]